MITQLFQILNLFAYTVIICCNGIVPVNHMNGLGYSNLHDDLLLKIEATKVVKDKIESLIHRDVKTGICGIISVLLSAIHYVDLDFF